MDWHTFSDDHWAVSTNLHICIYMFSFEFCTQVGVYVGYCELHFVMGTGLRGDLREMDDGVMLRCKC